MFGIRHAAPTAAVLGVLASTVSAAPAGANALAASAAAPTPAVLNVSVAVNRFSGAGRHTTAHATATATLSNFSGRTTSVRQQVTLSAATGASCQVLNLYLERLDLNLLGLEAHLGKVNLQVTGHARGGVLGQLFCRLSRGITGRIASHQGASAVAALNARLRQHPMHAVRFGIHISPQASASQAPAAQCQVLNLVLGPLTLNLLGLQVNLNQVTLNVVANRGGGVLGDLFCRLADSRATPGA